jgi:hypothetical protein
MPREKRGALSLVAKAEFPHQLCTGPIAAEPTSFSAHFSDHPTMRPTGFDPSRPIVVLDSGAQIAMGKQVAGNADLIGH